VKNRKSFDYVLVSRIQLDTIMANRVTENPHLRVLLLEAGGKDKSMVIHMSASTEIAALN